MIKTITTEELKAMMDRGDNFTLVETLSAMSYHGGHLPGAINLPPDQVIKRAYEVLPDRSASLVLYCGSAT
ncbi:MAG: rhodanese-like domain-containing protein [Bryobacteraceae bacterium]|jgi:rhodanese-related sulfurtransferase